MRLHTQVSSLLIHVNLPQFRITWYGNCNWGITSITLDHLWSIPLNDMEDQPSVWWYLLVKTQTTKDMGEGQTFAFCLLGFFSCFRIHLYCRLQFRLESHLTVKNKLGSFPFMIKSVSQGWSYAPHIILIANVSILPVPGNSIHVFVSNGCFDHLWLPIVMTTLQPYLCFKRSLWLICDAYVLLL